MSETYLRNEEKLSISVSALTENIIIFLDALMTNAGFNEKERERTSSSFVRFFHIALIQVAEKLQQLKADICENVTEDEKKYIIKVTQTSYEIESKMEYAMKLFRENYPNSLKSLMLHSKFLPHEISERNSCFVQFFSRGFFAISEMYFDLVQDIKENELNSDKTTDSFEEEEISETQDYKVFFKCKQQTISSVDLIRKARRYEIFCVSTTTGAKYALKVLRVSDPEDAEIRHLDNEMNISHGIFHPALRKAITRLTYQNRQALLLEWIEGGTVEGLFHACEVNIEEFLQFAREIVSSILAMHSAGFMHSKLSCEHILFNPNTKTVKVIGLGSSTNFNNEAYALSSSCEKTDLHCISPEQTRRTHYEVDFRSDFYSLGVIFFKIIYGKYPFSSSDSLHVINMHIYQESYPETPPDNIIIPNAISAMISKLMRKYPEDRYQSARGIIHDLDLMIAEKDNLHNVVLGKHDFPEAFFLPQKLLFRYSELHSLCSAFEKVGSKSFELAFISGDAGTGKSSLVLEFYKHSSSKGGFFVSGKFNKHKMPYSALLEAVVNFCDDLLLRDKHAINEYKERILEALGDEGKVLTDVIHNLHLITGHQNCTQSESLGREQKNRFDYVLLNFLKALCSPEAPLILALDDLHWADDDSWNFFMNLVSDRSITNLMLIFTYRRNEMKGNTSFQSFETLLTKNKLCPTKIHLQNLDQEATNEMVSLVLRVSPLQSYDLTAMLFKKTKGNPLFMRQTLKSLHEKGIIFYCKESFSWKWNLSSEDEKELTEDIVELIRKKILSFDKDTQLALRVASYFTGCFPMRALELITNKTDGVKGVLSTGMIVPCKGGNSMYRFNHDYFQQAAYSFLPENPKELFLYIGRKLWRTFSRRELKDNILLVANFLIKFVDLISCENERSRLTALFYESGKKCMISAAFEEAMIYFEGSIKVLDKNCWIQDYSFSISLFNIAAKAAYCNKMERRLEYFLQEIISHASTPYDLIYSHELKVRLYNEERKHREAVIVTDSILSRIGEEVNLIQVETVKDDDIEHVKSFFTGKSFDYIANMANMTSEFAHATMRIYNNMIICSIIVNSDLPLFIAVRMIQLTFRFGLCEYSNTAFCAFGASLCRRGDNMGYKFGKLALLLAKAKDNIPYVHAYFYTLISPYYIPIQDSLDPLLKAAIVSLELGKLESSNVCANVYCQHAYFSGVALNELLEKMEELSNTRGLNVFQNFLAVQQSVLNLVDEDCENPAFLIGEVFDYTKCIYSKDGDFFNSKILLFCAIIAFLFQEYKAASSFLKRIKKIQHYLFSMYHYPLYIFYEGMVCVALAKQKDNADVHVYNKVQENISILEDIAAKSPESYSNKLCLLKAELSVLRGIATDSIVLYTDAILSSGKNGLINEKAIALELAGCFFKTQNMNDEANKLLKESYSCYETWGARAKLNQLRRRYPTVFCVDNVQNDGTLVNFVVKTPHQLDSTTSVVSDLSSPSSIISRKRPRN